MKFAVAFKRIEPVAILRVPDQSEKMEFEEGTTDTELAPIRALNEMKKELRRAYALVTALALANLVGAAVIIATLWWGS